jgi:hypothetical protein
MTSVPCSLTRYTEGSMCFSGKVGPVDFEIYKVRKKKIPFWSFLGRKIIKLIPSD